MCHKQNDEFQPAGSLWSVIISRYALQLENSLNIHFKGSPERRVTCADIHSVPSTRTMSSSLHRNPPFRAEHIGSLLRPVYLLQAREDAEQDPEKQPELKSAEDEAIEAIVRAQLDIGFNSITDGEYRRHSKLITHRPLTWCAKC